MIRGKCLGVQDPSAWNLPGRNEFCSFTVVPCVFFVVPVVLCFVLCFCFVVLNVFLFSVSFIAPHAQSHCLFFNRKTEAFLKTEVFFNVASPVKPYRKYRKLHV